MLFWKNEGTKSVFFCVVSSLFGGENARILKHAQKPTIIHCILKDYKETCDTCDSKNTKTPVYTRVCARVREVDYSFFYTIQHIIFRFSISDSSFVCFASKVFFEKIHADCKKMTAHCPKNNVSFSIKQRIVFSKTTCHFQQNDVSFSIKQRLTFHKIRRCCKTRFCSISFIKHPIGCEKNISARNRENTK